MNTAIKPISPKKLTAHYMAALLFIAGLTIASHLVLANVVQQNQGSAAVINMSGRQRMLSQRMASLAAQYRLGDASAGPALMMATDKFESAEAILSAASRAPAGDDANARALQALYADGPQALDIQARNYIADARLVAALPPASPAAAAPLTALFAAARAPLLDALDQAVTIHERESDASTTLLKSIQWSLLGMVLVTLALEALAVFRPMINGIVLYTRAVLRLATIDPLTDVANRRGFLDRFEIERQRARRYRRDLSLLMLDADHFKQINDTYGHQAGDAVLRAISDMMRQVLRKSDIAGRLGGEEFAILMPETDLPGATILAERLRAEIADSETRIGGNIIKVTVSIGVAPVPTDDHGVETALRSADNLMYQAKNSGRNRTVTAERRLETA